MLKPLTPTDRQTLIRAWHNFNIVINRLPSSEISTLLAFHTRDVLDQLSSPAVNGAVIEAITRRVTLLVRQSELLLDIDDVLVLIQDALAPISHASFSPSERIG